MKPMVAHASDYTKEVAWFIVVFVLFVCLLLLLFFGGEGVLEFSLFLTVGRISHSWMKATSIGRDGAVLEFHLRGFPCPPTAII